jgi:hypothetical protein
MARKRHLERPGRYRFAAQCILGALLLFSPLAHGAKEPDSASTVYIAAGTNVAQARAVARAVLTSEGADNSSGDATAARISAYRQLAAATFFSNSTAEVDEKLFSPGEEIARKSKDDVTLALILGARVIARVAALETSTAKLRAIMDEALAAATRSRDPMTRCATTVVSGFMSLVEKDLQAALKKAQDMGDNSLAFMVRPSGSWVSCSRAAGSGGHGSTGTSGPTQPANRSGPGRDVDG